MIDDLPDEIPSEPKAIAADYYRQMGELAEATTTPVLWTEYRTAMECIREGSHNFEPEEDTLETDEEQALEWLQEQAEVIELDDSILVRGRSVESITETLMKTYEGRIVKLGWRTTNLAQERDELLDLLESVHNDRDDSDEMRYVENLLAKHGRL